MAKLWVLQSDCVKPPASGPDNWIEAITEDFGVVARIIRNRCPEKPIRSTISEVESSLPVYCVTEIIEKDKVRWSWKFIVHDKKGTIKYLRDVALARRGTPPEQYCLIQPVGREFVSPCPGWDMMGLMDHEHIDDDFLDHCLPRGTAPRGRLVGMFNAKPGAYFKRASLSAYFKERVAKYKKFRLDGSGHGS